MCHSAEPKLWGVQGAKAGGRLGCGLMNGDLQGSPYLWGLLPLLPQLWKHLKSSLRILFHLYFPRGEWSPGDELVSFVTASIPTLVPCPFPSCFPSLQATHCSKQTTHVHVLYHRYQEPVFKNPCPTPPPSQFPTWARQSPRLLDTKHK